MPELLDMVRLRSGLPALPVVIMQRIAEGMLLGDALSTEADTRRYCNEEPDLHTEHLASLKSRLLFSGGNWRATTCRWRLAGRSGPGLNCLALEFGR
jgi:hypothetical protein